MPKLTNRQLWEKATHLRRAWQTFANDKIRQKLANHPSALETLENSASNANTVSELLLSIVGATQSAPERQRIVEEMQEGLLVELFNGNLTAIGFRILPSRSAAPVIIDRSFFEFAEIEWEDDSAEYEGERYIRIRVFDPYADGGISIPQRGRPGSGQAIMDAISELIANPNNSFCDLPRKIACDKIRQKIGNEGISGNGLSDTNLSKYILQKCHKRKIK